MVTHQDSLQTLLVKRIIGATSISPKHKVPHAHKYPRIKAGLYLSRLLGKIILLRSKVLVDEATIPLI